MMLRERESAEERLSAGESRFTKEDTRAMKGVAVLLMLFHHLACFEDRFPVGFPGFKALIPALGEYIQPLGAFGKMCVPLFFFLGGYGLAQQWRAGRLSVRKRIVSLYKSYWKVFLIYVPIAYCFFARTGDNINVLATRYAVTSAKTLISTLVSNFVGFGCSINGEWWFFQYYLILLPLGACFCHACRKSDSFWREMLYVVCIDAFFSTVLPSLVLLPGLDSVLNNMFFSMINKSGRKYAGSFFMGIVFAKYDGLAAVKGMISKLTFRRAACVAACFVIFWCYAFVVNGGTMIYTPLLICFVSVLLDNVRPLKRLLGFVGRYGTNMWLIHTFYCYYFLEVTKLVYCTTSVWVDYLILAAMSLASAVLVDKLWNALGKGWDGLKARRRAAV